MNSKEVGNQETPPIAQKNSHDDPLPKATKSTSGTSASVILRNIGSVWVGFVINLAITFYLTPILIKKLGPEGYSIWVLLQSLTGYYGLIDMGLRAGVTQTITKRIVSGDNSSVLAYINGILPLLAKTALFVIFAGIISGFVLSKTLSVSQPIQESIWPMVFFQSIGIGITMLSFPFSAILVGLQRYDLSVGLAIFTRIISLICTLLVLRYSSSVLYLSISILCVNVFDQLLRYLVAIYFMPQLRQIRPKTSRTELRELYRVGGWNFAVSISQQLLQRFNTLIAAYWFPIFVLVPYNLAESLAEQSSKVTTLASRVLFPAFAHLNHTDKADEARVLFQITSRISITFSLVAITVGLIWFEPFMNLWLRSIDDRESVISLAKQFYVAFGLINVLTSLRTIGWQLLMGKDKMEFFGKVMMFESALAIALALFFGSTFGILGLAIGNLVAMAISTFGIYLPEFSKLVNSSVTSNAKAIFVRPIAYSLVTGLSVVVLSRAADVPKDWISLFIYCFIPTLAILTLAIPVLLTKSELMHASRRLLRFMKFA
jgi:O-antigen/teichoic acid export membrane protein